MTIVLTPRDTSRRQLKKLKTKQALADAALELLTEHGYPELTVEAITEKAGVSRRTFFNYFPSLNAALSYHVDQMLGRLAATIASVPAGESVVDLAFEAISELAADDSIGRVAVMHLEAEKHTALRATALVSWDKCRRELTTSIVSRYADEPPFEVATWVHVLLGACQSAFHAWSEEIEDLDSIDYARLEELIQRALNILQSGFADVLPRT